MGRSRGEVPKPTVLKAPAPKFQEEDSDSPPPKEPHPDDIPKGEEVPQLKRINAPPEVRKTYFPVSSILQQRYERPPRRNSREPPKPTTKLETIDEVVSPAPKRPPPKLPVEGEDDLTKHLADFTANTQGYVKKTV